MCAINVGFFGWPSPSSIVPHPAPVAGTPPAPPAAVKPNPLHPKGARNLCLLFPAARALLKADTMREEAPMDIHQNLKRYRLVCGMTQEQVAEQLYTTRQTVSNYETGRTRPDLDALARLAEIYGVPPEFLLYGDREAHTRRRLHRAAWIAVGCRLFLLLLTSAFLCGIHRWLPLPSHFSGSDPAYAIMEARFALTNACETVDGLAGLAFSIALLLLLIRDLSLRGSHSMRDRALLFLVLTAGSFAVSLPWGLFDPLFAANYRFAAYHVICSALWALLIDLSVLAFRAWRGRRKTEE